jgi:hypothetical protein
MTTSDVLKVDVSRRPSWWLNVVYDYEDNVLGSRDKEYPSEKLYQLQHLERYGFVTDEIGQWAVFPNPKDYTLCLLKYGAELCRQ